MGNSTNNAVEFGALELGLEILSRERMTNTIVEGDSTLVINTMKKLQNGIRVAKYRDAGAWHTPYKKSRSVCKRLTHWSCVGCVGQQMAWRT
jgi:ribonuclease HI